MQPATDSTGITEVCAAAIEAARQVGIDPGDVMVVGGAVRDALLGRPITDLDLVIAGDVGSLAAAIANSVGGSYTLVEAFGTASLTSVVQGRTWTIDVAQSRSEIYAAPGALPEVAPAPLDDDWKRRDFTINTLMCPLPQFACPLGRSQVHSPTTGLDDLDAGLMRVLHDNSFIDDPTRIVRTLRYAHRLGLTVEPHTAKLISAAIRGGALSTVSRDRIRAELELVLEEPTKTASDILLAILDAGIDLGALLGVVHGRDIADLWQVMSPVVAAPLEKFLAAAVFSQGQHGGDHVQSAITSMVESVGISSNSVRRVDELVTTLHCAQWCDNSRDVLAATNYDALELTRMMIEESGAARMVARGNEDERLWKHEHLVHDVSLIAATPTWREILAEALTAIHNSQPALNGDDLLQLGIQEGPAVGELLDSVRNERLAGRVQTRDQEIQLVEQLREQA